MGGVGAFSSTPTTFYYAANEVSRPKRLARKKRFFYRKYFFALFFTFSCSSTSQFSVIFTVFYSISIGFSIEMELAEARNRYVAVLCQKSILRTAVSGVPGVELDIKTFLKTYMNNICGTKKNFFWRRLRTRRYGEWKLWISTKMCNF